MTSPAGSPPTNSRDRDAVPDSAVPIAATRPPRHVAIIMDGNGRWAQRRGLGRKAGHDAGSENIRRVIRRFGELGVTTLTLYAFSTENWGRPKQEIGWLMHIIGRAIKRETAILHENGVRLRHLGRLEVLSKPLQRQVREAEALTLNNTRMTVCIAFNYGGRAEIVDAVRRIVTEGIPAGEIDEATISARLYASDLPEPDLIIRTAGEMRLSNFLMWQSAYAEYYVTHACWPDFDEREIDSAIEAFGHRQRRFGIVADSPDATRPPRLQG